MKPLKGVAYDWRVTFASGREIQVRAYDREQAERIARKRRVVELGLTEVNMPAEIVSVTVA